MSTKAPRSISALSARLKSARLKGPTTQATERARRMLGVYLESAEAHGVPFRDLVGQLASGTAALRIAGAELEQQAADPAGPMAEADCSMGCAFCCILSDDGGTVTEAEARQVHAALAPMAGGPDGRDWHPRACAALDPETRLCRVYEARPLLCRTYLSRDVEACKQIAEGTPAAGAGVLGAQGVMLSAQALARAMLKGVTSVPSYALAVVTAGAADGENIETTLGRARQKPRGLEDERARLSGF